MQAINNGIWKGGVAFAFHYSCILGWVISSGRYVTLQRNRENFSHFTASAQDEGYPQKKLLRSWGIWDYSDYSDCFCEGFLASKCKIKIAEKILLTICIRRRPTQLQSVFPHTSVPAFRDLWSTDKHMYKEPNKTAFPLRVPGSWLTHWCKTQRQWQHVHNSLLCWSGAACHLTNLHHHTSPNTMYGQSFRLSQIWSCQTSILSPEVPPFG